MFHRWAVRWLRDDLAAYARLADQNNPQANKLIEHRLAHWLADADFAGVRGAEALARLPAAEREPWQKLWSDVADLLARAQTMKPPKKSDSK